MKEHNNTNNLSKNKQKQPSNRMYVLVLDTETTGLFPKGGVSGGGVKHPLKPHCAVDTAPLPLPYAVQISYAIIDTSSPFFPIVEDYDAIIRISDSTPLPAESVAIHGITREISQTKGVPIEHALSILQRSLDTYDIQLVVGHNIAFDLRVIDTERGRQAPPSTPPCINGFAPSPSSEGASSAPLRPPLCSSPSSSPDPTSTPTIKAQAGGLRGLCPLPDPTSTPGEGATSAPLRPPPCPSAQIKNSPGTDSNTFAYSTDKDKGGLRGLCPLPDSTDKDKDKGGLRGLCPLHKGGHPRRDLRAIPQFCTARESVGVCNLRVESMYGGVYLKFGKLGQVFEILFKERDAARGVDMKVFEKYMHNSRVDVLMCARVYVWLCYSVDVFDAWYCEMQNYADENFINVDDSHLVVGGQSPLRSAQTPQPTIGAEGFKHCVVGVEAPSNPNPSPSASPSPSPRRSDRLRLKRMLMQEQEEGPSAQIKNNPLTSRGFKGDSVPLQEQGSILVM